MKSKIYYWSPFVSEVATVKSVINSAYSVNKYLNKKYESYIIDVFGEFEKFEKEIKTKNIKLIKFPKSNIVNFFPKPGFLRSRVLYIFIFLRLSLEFIKFPQFLLKLKFFLVPQKLF